MATLSSPSDIARETLKVLASRKLAPTPDNYAQAYQQISGITTAPIGAAAVIENIAQQLSTQSAQKDTLYKTVKQAVVSQNWEQCQNALQKLITSDQTTADSASPAPIWSNMIRDLLRQIEIPHKGVPLSRKKEGVEKVLTRFAANPVELHEKLQNLIRSWSGSSNAEQIALTDPIDELTLNKNENNQPPVADTTASSHKFMPHLRELLANTLENTGHNYPDLLNEINGLVQQVRLTENNTQLNELAKQLRNLWLKLESRNYDKVKIQEGLLRLLRLMVENAGELVTDDKWIHGQIHTIQQIIEQPLNRQSIADAERNLRNVIIKQSTLKHSLNDAKVTLKNLMASFIDRLSDITETTGDYHAKIENYSHKISSTDNITELSHILADLMQDTKIIQASALRAHEELLLTRKQAQEAEDRVKQLEQELEEVSELVREDQLTGALNRRGMEEILDREFKRIERTQCLLSVALLDIDNFKQLNDTLGHQGGDEALIHLSKVIKEALRPSDSVARYGGEEFLIILPDTPLAEAMEITERLQRELTKKFFLHNNERKLITFSAGVALHMAEEDKESLIGRADQAMYHAKKTGKNKVVAASRQS